MCNKHSKDSGCNWLKEDQRISPLVFYGYSFSGFRSEARTQVFSIQDNQAISSAIV